MPSRMNAEPQMELVGRITGMVDCKWADPSTEALPGSDISLGRKYSLASGLMEIAYDTGARVILQGPVTYEVESAAGGYLSVGKLTARLEKKAEKVGSGQWAVGGKSDIRNLKAEISNPQSPIPNPPLSTLHSPLFTIKTPTATVTDLGTEFGVEVSQEGNTISHVFRGSVKLRVALVRGETEAITPCLARERIGPGGKKQR